MLVKNIVMTKTNVADVKARLSEYLDRVLAGERIIICRHNRPIAELRAIEEARLDPRPIGPLPGRPSFEVMPSFFEPLPEDELLLWETAPLQARTLEPHRAPVPHVAERRATLRASSKPRAKRRR